VATIPLLSGVGATEQAEFVTLYPLNLEPVAIDNKISRGQLRATSGAVPLGTGPGIDRGGITWGAQHYRVMGTKLAKVAANGEATEVGDVGGAGPVRMDYSFDRLGIRSGSALWYYDGSNLTQVTDEDLGAVVDMMWIDSFWMTTDGDSIVVTELADPFSVLPLKYGSAEEDPDMVTGLMKVRDEPYVLGRHTIQVFRNVGGNGFPFTVNEGATIPYGCVSASAKCYFAGSFAFVGGGRDEALGVRVAGQGDADKISTRAVDDALAAVDDPTSIVLESRAYRDEERLFVHLPEESWVFCARASLRVQEAVWYRVRSGGAYRIRNAVHAYGKIICGDLNSSALGLLSDDVSTHFGDVVEWEFHAGLIQGPGILHSAELIGLPGRGPQGEEATIFLSMTGDGETYSAEKAISAGVAGERRKRLQWRPHQRFTNYLGLRFRGLNQAMPGFAKCEAVIAPLYR
jgi:stabilization protein